jgi:hypothetical protein
MVFAACNSILSQELKIGMKTGIGTYSMSDLKKLNSEVQKLYPFDTKIVSNFPPYFYYEPELLLNSNKVSFGLVYSFQSTGSRVSAKDYSGEYRYDMKINSNSPGIYMDVEMWSKHEFSLSLYLTSKATFSKLRTSEYFMLLESLLINEISKYRAMNYNFEPGIILTRSVSHFTFGINAGYSIDFWEKSFHNTANKEIILINPESQKKVKPNWSGFRLGLSASVSLKKKS